MKSIVVDIGGRRQFHALLHETPTSDGEMNRRIMLATGWYDDPRLDSPMLLIPVEAVPDVVAALREVAS